MFAVSVCLGAAPGRGEPSSVSAGVVNFTLEAEGELAGGGAGWGGGGGDGGSRAGGVTVSPASPHVVAISVSRGGAPGLAEPSGQGAGGEGLAHELEGEDTGSSGHCTTHSAAGAGGRRGGGGGGGGGADIDDNRWSGDSGRDSGGCSGGGCR